MSQGEGGEGHTHRSATPEDSGEVVSRETSVCEGKDKPSITLFHTTLYYECGTYERIQDGLCSTFPHTTGRGIYLQCGDEASRGYDRVHV